MNLFDLGAVLVIAGAAALGYRSGAIPQLAGLAGAIVGGAAAIVALPLLEPILDLLDPLIRAYAVIALLLLLVGVGEAVGSGSGRALTVALGRGLVSAIDRAGGIVLGIAVGLGRLLDGSGLPDVFVGLEPVPAPPVDRPTDPQAAAIAALAEESTVRVTARTCDLQSSGSGFVTRRGYVVTNAHVVAGASTIRVGQPGQIVDATAVFFDAQLDLAVLWAPGLSSPEVRFSSVDPVRGALGAALGHPGGGALTILPAAVAGAYDAQGLDIYGERRVTRRILELRADIERGDSGGPFVLADGTVGGVIFAESRTDPDVGYALAASDVAIVVHGAVGRTSQASTGPCLD